MNRNRKVLIVLLALLPALLLLNFCLGASSITPAEILSALLQGEHTSSAARIFLYVRLPRTLAALLAGSALAVAGLLLQSILRNPLAAPSVIGVNSGAGLSALICMAFLPSCARLTPVFAFAGACLTVFFVYLLSRMTGASRTTIVLSGVAINSLLGAAMDMIVTLVPDAALSRSVFSIGGFDTATLRQLSFAAPLCALDFLITLLFRQELKLMLLGDDIAQSLGLKVNFFRALFLISAAMLSGAAVSFAGLLGFVGLIAPHSARMLCKNESFPLLITALFGAELCLLCDLIARIAFAPYELPVGVVLSFIGAPFFFYLLLARRKRSRHSAV